MLNNHANTGVRPPGAEGIDAPRASAGTGVIDSHVDQAVSGDVSVSLVRTHRARHVQHTPTIDHGSADGEQFWVVIQLSGTGRVCQAGREAMLLPGDLAATTTALSYEWLVDGPSEQLVMGLPAAPMRTRRPDLHHVTARRMAGTLRTCAALRPLAHAFRASEDPRVRATLGHALIHAVAACVQELDAPLPPRLHGAAARPSSVANAAGPHSALAGPSQREIDVLNLIARGCSYADAAKVLGVSTSTVCTHLRSVYSKLGAHSKNEAVFEARQLGWLV